MDTSPVVKSLVSLEDDFPDFLNETIDGSKYLLWPLMRFPIARVLGESVLNHHSVPRKGSRLETILGASRFLTAPAHSLLRVTGKRRGLFIGAGNTVHPSPSGTVNWLYDAHASALGADALILQERPVPRAGQRPSFTDTFDFSDALRYVEMKTRFRPATRSQVAQIERVASQAFMSMEMEVAEGQRQKVVRQVTVRVGRLMHMMAVYEFALKRTQPEVLFIQGASYLDRGPLIQEARRRGIHVAEHQHGWIGPSHPAYNFGRAFREGALREALPNTLLTYGEFWNDNIAFPENAVSIGKPHLEAMATRTIRPEKRRRELLYISSVFGPEKTMETLRAALESLPAGWTLAFRPHPSERETMFERYADVAHLSRFRFDTEPDVYKSLASVPVVMGTGSTVLYEALAMECEVLVIDDKMSKLVIDPNFFPRIAPVEDVIASLEDIDRTVKTPGISSLQREYLWQSQAVEGFTTWFDAIAAKERPR